MLLKSHWLKTAEYISIVACIVGLITTAITKKNMFMATPLTIALCLNFINRDRLSSRIHQQLNLNKNNLNIIEIVRQQDNKIKNIKQQLEEHQSNVLKVNNVNKVSQNHSEINKEKINAYLDNFMKKINQISNKQQQLEQTQQQHQLTIQKLEELFRNFEKEQKNNYKNIKEDIEDKLQDKIEQLFKEFKTEEEKLKSKFEELENTFAIFSKGFKIPGIKISDLFR